MPFDVLHPVVFRGAQRRVSCSALRWENGMRMRGKQLLYRDCKSRLGKEAHTVIHCETLAVMLLPRGEELVTRSV